MRDYRQNYGNSRPYRPNYRKQSYSNTNNYSFNYAPRSNYRNHDYSNYNSHVNAKNQYSNVNYNSNFAPIYRSKYYQPRYRNWNYIDSECDNEWYGPQGRSTFRNRQPFPSAGFTGREAYWEYEGNCSSFKNSKTFATARAIIIIESWTLMIIWKQ